MRVKLKACATPGCERHNHFPFSVVDAETGETIEGVSREITPEQSA